MSRSADQVLAEMLALVPQGFAWPQAGLSGESSLLAAVLRPMAIGIAELEASAEAALAEVDPRTAAVALADFFRALGPDPCGRDISALPAAEQRAVAHGRWTARGGASKGYFYALAAAYGVPITITELVASQAGQMRADDELVELGESYVWVVTLPLGAWTEFRADESVAGDRLFDFVPSALECEFARRRPAHTEVVFNYQEAT